MAETPLRGGRIDDSIIVADARLHTDDRQHRSGSATLGFPVLHEKIDGNPCDGAPGRCVSSVDRSIYIESCHREHHTCQNQ